MTAPYKGSICLATNSNFVLPGSRSNDMLIYIGNSNQNILFGISNQNTLLSINSSNNSLAFSGNLSFSNQLALSGIMLTQKTSTTVNNLTSSLTAINGFNYTSNGSLQFSMSNGNTSIQFQQANTTYMTLTSNGFLGIGTSNPGSLLSIAGGVTVGYSNLAAPTNGLIVQGNVGIGTINPLYPLHVYNSNGLMIDAGGSNNTVLSLSNAYSSINQGIASVAGNFSISAGPGDYILRNLATTGKLLFQNGSGNAALTVNSNNTIGVGMSTPNPLYSMTVNNTLQVNAANTINNKLLVLYDNGPTDSVATACNFYGFGINGGILRYQSPPSAQHQWYIGNNVNMTLSNSMLTIPNIGNTSNYTPTISLSDTNKGIKYSGVNSGVTWLTNFPTDGIAVYGFNDGCLGTTNSGNKAVLCWNSSGNVGIGLSNPAYTLDVYASSGINSRLGSNLYLMGGPLSPSIGFNAYFNSGWFNGGVGTTYTGALQFLNGNFQFIACPATTANGSNISSSLPILVSISNNGYVGIGTTNPAYTLEVNGTSHFTGIANFNMTGGTHAVNIGGDLGVTGTVLTNSSGNGIINTYSITCTTISKSSGTFDIQHPTIPDTRLVHSFIEGPRCDLIYRGNITLSNGIAKVNIDTDSVAVPDCAMSEGTFEALCTNPDIFLQNKTSFDNILGTISGNILTITCQNITSTASISWMVIAERKDSYIKAWDRTNADGYLVTQYKQP